VLLVGDAGNLRMEWAKIIALFQEDKKGNKKQEKRWPHFLKLCH